MASCWMRMCPPVRLRPADIALVIIYRSSVAQPLRNSAADARLQRPCSTGVAERQARGRARSVLAEEVGPPQAQCLDEQQRLDVGQFAAVGEGGQFAERHFDDGDVPMLLGQSAAFSLAVACSVGGEIHVD